MPYGFGSGLKVFREPRREGRRVRRAKDHGEPAPSSRVPLPHPRPYSGAREGKGRRVAGELAPAPGYTEEISLSLCLSACEPPPGPLPIPSLAPLLSFHPSSTSPTSLPWAPGHSPEGCQGSCPFPYTTLSSTLLPPYELASVPSAVLLIAMIPPWGANEYPSIPCPFSQRDQVCSSACDTVFPLSTFLVQKTFAGLCFPL